MAEGQTSELALLRACAEAYERICFSAYSKVHFLNHDLPYGLGVGFTKKGASLRAFGEYFERRTYSLTDFSVWRIGEESLECFSTPAGAIFIYLFKDRSGYIGSGYGRDELAAKESAGRSSLRKVFTKKEIKRFKVTEKQQNLNSIEISPIKMSWLHCMLVTEDQSLILTSQI